MGNVEQAIIRPLEVGLLSLASTNHAPRRVREVHSPRSQHDRASIRF